MLLNFLLGASGFVLFLVVTQDVHIFPGALLSLFSGRTRDPRTLPSGVESIFISTPDAKKIELWRLAPQQEVPQKDLVALIFHGNGGALESFYLFQLWFSSLGICSYAFDYRGFGKSSGWPGEKGISTDSDAVWSYCVEREKLDPQQIIIFGFSIGSGPASRIAALHSPRALILTSPFTDLRRVVREHGLLAILAPFLRHRFPVKAHIEKLKSTSLLLVHGGNDKIISRVHAEELERSYRGSGQVTRLFSEGAGHNLVFYELKDEMAKWIE